MEILQIKPTKSSPKIILNSNSNIHEISGESYPENSLEFYKPIIKWLEEYLSILEDDEVILNVELYYFNSSSSKVLMDIFDMFEESCNNGKKIIVNWIYETGNDASLEYGEEFAEDFENLTFNLVEK